MPNIGRVCELSDSDEILGTFASLEHGSQEINAEDDKEYSDEDDLLLSETDTPLLRETSSSEDDDPALAQLPRLRRSGTTKPVALADSTYSAVEQEFLERYFQRLRGKQNKNSYARLQLDNFIIYNKEFDQQYPESLHSIAEFNPNNASKFCFSGTLKHEDGSQEDLLDIDITGIYIENIGVLTHDLRPDTVSCRDTISIQSHQARAFNVFYYLGNPHDDYKANFSAFA